MEHAETIKQNIPKGFLQAIEERRNQTTFIYALRNGAGAIEYIGESLRPERRFREHKKRGFVLIEVPFSERKEYENYFIAYFRELGCILWNKQGPGTPPRPPETRARMRARLRAHPIRRAQIAAQAKRRAAAQQIEL